MVTYDRAWPERFRAERERIGRALGQTARSVEHIGSTAVPGLAAKAIIDILLVVEDVDDEAAYGPALKRSGYVLRVREPGHRMFRTPQRDVHVHVYSAGSPEIRRYLLFRDWLRESATDRDAYEQVKRELAAREWEDMNFYAQAKDSIVAEISQERPQHHLVRRRHRLHAVLTERPGERWCPAPDGPVQQHQPGEVRLLRGLPPGGLELPR